MGILGRCLCPSLVYEIASLEAGSYCSGPGERRRAFRLGFWLQRQKDYVCVIKPAVFIDEIFRIKCDFDLQKIQTGQQRFIPFYLKAQLGSWASFYLVSLLTMVSISKLTSWPKMASAAPAITSTFQVPGRRRTHPTFYDSDTNSNLCSFSTPKFSRVSCVSYNSILTQSTWRY